MVGEMDGWMYGCWINGWMDVGLMDRCTDGWMNEWMIHGRTGR